MWANVALYPGGTDITFSVKSKEESIPLCELWNFSVGNPRVVSVHGEGKRRGCSSQACAQHKIHGERSYLLISVTSVMLFQFHNSRKRESIIYAKPSNLDQKTYKARWNMSAIFIPRWKVCFTTSQFFRSIIGILIFIALGVSLAKLNTPLFEGNYFS